MTDQTQRSSALIEENRLLHDTIEAITNSIIVFDAKDHRTLLANSAASRGRNVYGKPCYQLNHQRDTPCGGSEHECPLEAICRSKRPVVVEHIHHEEGGGINIVEISAYPILDAAGTLTQIVEVSRDVTDRRRIEEYQVRMQKSLEHLHETVLALSMCSNDQEIAEVTLEAATEVFGWPSTYVIRLLPNAGREGMLLGKTTNGANQTPGDLYDADLADRTLERCQTHILSAQDQSASPWHALPNFKVGVSAPIQNLGCFQAILTGPGFVSPDHLRLLRLLLSHTEDALNRLSRQNDLEIKALHDSLTGAFNRHYLDVVLEREVKRAERYGNQIAIMMVDINNFKSINDQFGHLQGDQILTIIAKELLSEVRESDFLFRYGGDEFLVLMPQAENPAESVASRIHARIDTLNAQKSFGIGDHPVAISTGISYWNPTANQSIKSAFALADREMYRNKPGKALSGP